MNIIENFENIFKHKLIAARRKIVCNLHDSSDWPDCCVGFIRNWSSTVGPLFIISLKYFLLVDTRLRLLEIWDKIFYTSRPSEVLSNIPAVTWCSLWLLLLTVVLSKGSHQSRKKTVKNEGLGLLLLHFNLQRNDMEAYLKFTRVSVWAKLYHEAQRPTAPNQRLIKSPNTGSSLSSSLALKMVRVLLFFISAW